MARFPLAMSAPQVKDNEQDQGTAPDTDDDASDLGSRGRPEFQRRGVTEDISTLVAEDYLHLNRLGSEDSDRYLEARFSLGFDRYRLG